MISQQACYSSVILLGQIQAEMLSSCLDDRHLVGLFPILFCPALVLVLGLVLAFLFLVPLLLALLGLALLGALALALWDIWQLPVLDTHLTASVLQFA